MPALAQLTILAPGLLGGSVARAARTHGVASRIVLWARRPESRLNLREQPWCDAVADTANEAVRGAQLVVLAAPVDQIVPLARQIAPLEILPTLGLQRICPRARISLESRVFFGISGSAGPDPRRAHHEQENIPTEQPQAQAHPRVSRTHGHP